MSSSSSFLLVGLGRENCPVHDVRQFSKCKTAELTVSNSIWLPKMRPERREGGRRDSYSHSLPHQEQEDSVQMTHVCFFNIIIKWAVFVGRRAHSKVSKALTHAVRVVRDDNKLVFFLVDTTMVNSICGICIHNLFESRVLERADWSWKKMRSANSRTRSLWTSWTLMCAGAHTSNSTSKTTKWVNSIKT